MKWVLRAILSAGSCQEVNSTWYPEIEEPIKSREKHYSTVLYILIIIILLLMVVSWCWNDSIAGDGFVMLLP